MFCRYCGKEAGGNYCPSCGKQLNGEIPQLESPLPAEHDATFQSGKRVIGILSLLLSFLILFQSCAVGLANTLEPTGDLGGSAGFFLIVCWWISGIIGCAAGKSRKATMAGGVIYVLAAVAALLNAQVFQDLSIYAVISAVFAVVYFLSAFGWQYKNN